LAAIIKSRSARQQAEAIKRCGVLWSFHDMPDLARLGEPHFAIEMWKEQARLLALGEESFSTLHTHRESRAGLPVWSIRRKPDVGRRHGFGTECFQRFGCDAFLPRDGFHRIASMTGAGPVLLEDAHFHEHCLDLLPVTKDCLRDLKRRPFALAGEAVGNPGLLMQTESITRLTRDARASEVVPLAA
jgi:hypothetical protein